MQGAGRLQRWFREHQELIRGALIKKTWGAGSRAQNFEGSGEQGTPHAEPHFKLRIVIILQRAQVLKVEMEMWLAVLVNFPSNMRTTFMMNASMRIPLISGVIPRLEQVAAQELPMGSVLFVVSCIHEEYCHAPTSVKSECIRSSKYGKLKKTEKIFF